MRKGLLIILLLAAALGLRAQQKDVPYVVLVSFDGFRYDYVERYNLPNFKAFIKGGAGAEGIIPCFPSMTFPNHYSIVTGMYPGTHGLVNNDFYDPVSGKEYEYRDTVAVTDPSFYGGTPLWRLARNAGIRSASYFWVGSEQSDPALRPDYSFRYKASVPFERRINQVIAWLKLPEADRPHFITLYFSEPDHDSHDTGPNSEVTRKTLFRMDSLLGNLVGGIKATKLPVNIILVSDHGMSENTVVPETYVFFDELVKVDDPGVKIAGGGTLANVYVKDPKRIDSLYQLLKSKEKNFRVYRRADIPKQWHYDNPRTGDLLIVPSPYHLLRPTGRADMSKSPRLGSKRGDHGYDPAVVKDMLGIFYATGPNIKPGTKLPPVRNIDVYPLIAQILGLNVPAIDGDFKALKGIFLK